MPYDTHIDDPQEVALEAEAYLRLFFHETGTLAMYKARMAQVQAAMARLQYYLIEMLM